MNFPAEKLTQDIPVMLAMRAENGLPVTHARACPPVILSDNNAFPYESFPRLLNQGLYSP